MPTQYIDREECIGDSLVKLNNNFAGLDTDITNSFNSLRTLINTLSTNMQQIGNFPYARFRCDNVSSYNSGNTRVIFNAQDININTTSIITPNLLTGAFTLIPGVYTVRVASGALIAATPGYGGTNLIAYNYFLQQNSPATTIIRGTNAIAETTNSAGFYYKSNFLSALEGNFQVNSTTDYSINLNVSSSSLAAGSNVTIAEFWKIG